MGDVKGEVKKITVRFNLQNSTDARIWNNIEEQIQQKQNNYLKELILLGLQQEEQAAILEEVREIKRLLKETDRKWSLDEIREIKQLFRDDSGKWNMEEKTAELKKKERLEEEAEAEIPEQAEGQPALIRDETMEKKVSIDPDVMNFLDTL